MNIRLKKILYFFLGLMGWAALLCSVAASQVTNEALMKQGFSKFAATDHLGVSPSRYGDYAHALSQYMDGKADAILVPDENGQMTPAFSDKENAHMADVRALVSGLKWVRWIGGGGAVAIMAALYLKKKRGEWVNDLVRGFVSAAAALIALFLLLGAWGLINFQGLFWAFHRLAFSNNLWLLNPQTDLLVALMPLPFFTWYAGEILKSLLPILGVMLLVIIAFRRAGTMQKKES